MKTTTTTTTSSEPFRQFKEWLATPTPLEESDPGLAEHFRLIANRQHTSVKTLVVENNATMIITHDGRRIIKHRQMPGRNDPCHCGSGRKFKKCCLG